MLGERRDLNPRIMESQSIALPLGDARQLSMNPLVPSEQEHRQETNSYFEPEVVEERYSFFHAIRSR